MSFKVKIPVDIVVTYYADVDVVLSHDEYQEYVQGKNIKEIVTDREVRDVYDANGAINKEFMFEELTILWHESWPNLD